MRLSVCILIFACCIAVYTADAVESALRAPAMSMMRLDQKGYIHLGDWYGLKAATPAPLTAIYFGRLDCPPCEASMPHFLAFFRLLQEKQPGAGIRHLVVLTDPLSRRNELTAYAAGHNLTGPEVVMDPYGKLKDAFALAGVPCTVFIRADGTIAARIPGANNYAVRLKEAAAPLLKSSERK